MYIHIVLHRNRDVADKFHHFIQKIKQHNTPFHLHCNHNMQSRKEKFEDIKGVIESRKSWTNRQHNGHTIKDKGTNNDIQNIIHKPNDRATLCPLNSGGELDCSGSVITSCIISGNRRDNLAANREDRTMITTNGTYLWSFVTQILRNAQSWWKCLCTYNVLTLLKLNSHVNVFKIKMSNMTKYKCTVKPV